MGPLKVNNMEKKKETEKQRIGRMGEDTACKFLMKQGFSIIERNYWKKWGEIDIIAQKAKKLHFVEVKTVSRENLAEEVTREIDSYQPEENVHPAKLKRLGRTIQTYLLEKDLEDGQWQFDVLAVFLDVKNKQARVRFTENVVL